MALVGTILQEAVRLRGVLQPKPDGNGYDFQVNTLRKLLKRAKDTYFGRRYGFGKILRSSSPELLFREQVPVHGYDSIYRTWWHRTLRGEPDVCWSGKTKYFALTSGTSGAPSKQVPITTAMLRTMRRAGIRQILTLPQYNLAPDFFEKSILMLGGSISLNEVGVRKEGDLSGILASKLPLWFYHFYKPGRHIAMERDWSAKLEQITRHAREWDIGVIAGVPAWVQILLEKIITHYKVKHIHEIWPNFLFFVHGGVYLEPYKKCLTRLLGKELHYLETYLASEGFLAYQGRPCPPGRQTMQLVLDNGIFFEFVPMNEDNFNSEGDVADNPRVLLLDQVKEGEEYALLISTCAGAWRYLIGDTIRFTSLKNYEIAITGRTKHFLSLCGEHLSIDNMNQAIRMVADELNLHIREFTVAGIPCKNLFAHHWYIGTDEPADAGRLSDLVDQKLKEINDDYRVERQAALKEVIVEVLPNEAFYHWMNINGKTGGQNKFPRVLKDKKLEEWKQFITTNYCAK